MAHQHGASRLGGRRAIITGGSSGIGEATARRFVAEGARVALVARGGERLQRVVESLGADAAVAIAADVTDPDDVDRWTSEAWNALGGSDILVNSAGIAQPAPLPELTVDLWRRTIDTNLSGTFYASKSLGSRMAAGEGGTIVNVGSELSFLGMATNVAYCTAKAGIVGLTRAFAAELCPKVTVNAVCPGPVDTPLLRGAFDAYVDLYDTADLDGVEIATKKRVPLGRLATGDEVARAIVYLAADAGYATGALLSLDGGTTALVPSE